MEAGLMIRWRLTNFPFLCVRCVCVFISSNVVFLELHADVLLLLGDFKGPTGNTYRMRVGPLRI